MTRLEGALHRRLIAASSASSPTLDEIAAMVRAEDPLRSAAEVDRSAVEISARLTGLGPIDRFLADPLVSDVMVNGAGPVWIERGGQLQVSDVTLSAADVEVLVERIMAPLGRRADRLHCLADGRLADGSRVHVVMPPLAVDGPYVTIRRFGIRSVPLEELASDEVASLLRDAVRRRSNIVVSGATGSGKTTLLNALAATISSDQRIVTVEDAAELRLPVVHVVRLESRPATSEGAPEVPIRELLRSALRMRPDRLVLGEVRGAEAFDLLTALGTGHDGAMSTVHANSAGDALHRIESLALLAGVGLPLASLRTQLAAAVDLVVHIERAEGARRLVGEVVEVERATTSDGIVTRRLAAGHAVVAAPRREPRANR